MHITSVDILTASVVADSIVTMLVGWRLGRRAHKETTRAAETLKPVMQEEISRAVAMLIPVLAERAADFIRPAPDHAAPDPKEIHSDNGQLRSISSDSVRGNANRAV